MLAGAGTNKYWIRNAFGLDKARRKSRPLGDDELSRRRRCEDDRETHQAVGEYRPLGVVLAIEVAGDR
jgi:hypothetical protein